MKNKKLPYLTQLVKKIAPKVGARIIVEPEWGVVSQLVYRNGVVRSVRMYSLDLNTIASADIAKDKDYAKFFMKKHGYTVAPGKTFFSERFAKVLKSNRNINSALIYAKKIKYPLIVKPNSQSQGHGVALIHSEKELKIALKNIFKIDRIALLERYLPGRDYRVVVLDGEIISAYERIALSVFGDGRSSVLQLLKKKQKDFIVSGRDTKINFSDIRIKNKLKNLGFSFNTILDKNRKVYLLDNANLSTGGDSLDVTDTIHPGFKKMAINLTKNMGLRIAGVDLMVTEGDITKAPTKKNHYIIEINAAPGLDHYVTTGKKQKEIVEDMYLKVFKALAHTPI